MRRWLLSLCLAVAVTACGTNAAASPTPAPAPLAQAELKYRVMDAGGRIEFCDPDFYPVARADESAQANLKIAQIQADAETYAAITKRVGTDTLAVYREWKALNALVFGQLTFGSPLVAQAYPFSYLSTGGPSATASKANGIQVEGQVDLFGKVNITKRTSAGPLNCPICLALGTRIAAPSGELAVEDLRVGDVVWTSIDGSRVAAPLVAVGRTPVPSTHEVVRLGLSDGRVVYVSPGHPTADGRYVGELRPGDELDGASVIDAERVAYSGGFTFDVLPAGSSGAYWANGVLLGSTLR